MYLFLLASKTAAAAGHAEEPHLQTDSRTSGRAGPDGPSEDRADRPGVPAGKHTGAHIHLDPLQKSSPGGLQGSQPYSY